MPFPAAPASANGAPQPAPFPAVQARDVVASGQNAVADLVSTAATEPELVVVAAVAVAVAALLGWLVLQQLRWTPGMQLLGVIGGRDAVTVLMHPNPDPDAMGCAVAVARLADHVDVDATIQYPGRIRHHENRAFRTVLDLELDRIESADELSSDAVVLVDHNHPRGFDGAEDVEPLAVVDHHPGNGTGSAFTDVRPEYGACASIIAEYLRELDATLLNGEHVADGELTIPSRLATGLVYGILADTRRLTDGSTLADFEACQYLYDGVDRELLDRIANPQVDAETLEVKARAITDREVRPPYAVSDVGTVSNVDAIPQAAEELSGLDTVSAVVVLGDDGETIHISGRSRDDRVHMGDVIAAAVDEFSGGGGGHARMGGGQVLLDGTVARMRLRERLFDELTAEGA